MTAMGKSPKQGLLCVSGAETGHKRGFFIAVGVTSVFQLSQRSVLSSFYPHHISFLEILSRGGTKSRLFRRASVTLARHTPDRRLTRYPLISGRNVYVPEGSSYVVTPWRGLCNLRIVPNTSLGPTLGSLGTTYHTSIRLLNSVTYLCGSEEPSVIRFLA